MRHETSIISGFSIEATAEMTGLTIGQLKLWDKTKFFQPSFADENRRLAYSRVYSFHDLASLQVLKTLRIDLGVSMQHLRDVKTKLAELPESSWTNTILYVVKKRVVFGDISGRKREIVGGQYIVDIPLEVIRRSMQNEVERVRKRGSADYGKSQRTKFVARNQRVIAGTRVSIKAIRTYIEDGFSNEDILSEYPTLSEQDIKAVRNEIAA
jgi:DNA-binding transcriptional MerR regulator